MELKFVEAGHPVDEETGTGGNWGKFAVGRWTPEQMREPTQFPGCEGQRITSLHGSGARHIWLLDLQTGEGARFNINNTIPVDVPHQLKSHQIWVCPMFEPFMVWLWDHIHTNLRTWWDDLPRTVTLPADTPFDFAGYRRPGPNHEILERFEQIEALLTQLLAGRGGEGLSVAEVDALAAEPGEINIGAHISRLSDPAPARRRVMTHRSLDEEQV